MKINSILGIAFSGLLIFGACTNQAQEKTADVETNPAENAVIDPLPSWNDTETKKAIMAYVDEVTTQGNANFIPVSNRIATFDNDGTLWSEKPFYFQLFFAIDRVKAMAPEHPEWKTTEPFKSVLNDDLESLMAQGTKAILTMVIATHAGMTTDEFETSVTDWLVTAEHPTKKKPFTDLVFQPMIELLEYLRAHDFKTFIVSGGGIEFMRPWTEGVYGIPKDQVIGSSIKTKYDYNNGNPTITRLAEIDLIDDKAGKPVGINRYIGQKPVFASGNSDGDLEMMRWSDSNPHLNFQLYVHHTDSVREWAYDRKTHIGTFDKALDEATEKGWTIIDMAKDWKVIYPFELKN